LGFTQDKPNEDQKKIQGVWRVIEQKPAPMDEIVLELVVINNNKLVFHYKLGERFTKRTNIVETEFKLNPTSSPKEIDFTNTEGAIKKPYLGLYDINGAILRICYRRPESTRPKDFKDSRDKNSATVFLELKRVPPRD
jgi:uncharacterized protein (TIGR03067 family)